MDDRQKVVSGIIKGAISAFDIDYIDSDSLKYLQGVMRGIDIMHCIASRLEQSYDYPPDELIELYKKSTMLCELSDARKELAKIVYEKQDELLDKMFRHMSGETNITMEEQNEDIGNDAIAF